MTDLKSKALRILELAEKASPVWRSFVWQKTYVSVESEEGIGQCVPLADREFIAEFRTTAPELAQAFIDQLESLKSISESYKKYYSMTEKMRAALGWYAASLTYDVNGSRHDIGQLAREALKECG